MCVCVYVGGGGGGGGGGRGGKGMQPLSKFLLRIEIHFSIDDFLDVAVLTT